MDKQSPPVPNNNAAQAITAEGTANPAATPPKNDQQFSQWAQSAFGHPAYPWQIALGSESKLKHRLIRIPTGFGKTLGVLSAWLFNRVIRNDPDWPLRIVWALPMRTLVEQTEAECKKILSSQNILWDGHSCHDGKVGVHVLMGGADPGDFHLHPEHPAILVGTQDMLLSRALNRGYGAARGRWPIDFGLLSQDTLWVLDEVQLMGAGFATAMQLTVFRDQYNPLRPTATWAMSATLQPEWLKQSPDTKHLVEELNRVNLLPEDEKQPLWANSHKTLETLEPLTSTEVAKYLLEAHGALNSPNPLTLAVCNTVNRATKLFRELEKLVKSAKSDTQLHLIHSRFRGKERQQWQQLLSKDSPTTESRIIVATQVIEAGVDISANLLMTEVCPWPSLVQRLGRLARRENQTGRAVVLGLDTTKEALPYSTEEMDAAWKALQSLTDVSPRALETFERELPSESLSSLYPYEPLNLLLQEEIEELFDTSADLSGGDIDISRFIRDGDEHDLSVAWITIAKQDSTTVTPPDSKLRPSRNAIVSVPFLQARDWLFGKGAKGKEPKYLPQGTHAFVWDYLEGKWRRCERQDLRPGVQILVDATKGGYDEVRGFNPTARTTVPVIPLIEADAHWRTNAAQDNEDLSQAAWQTIGYHSQACTLEVEKILTTIGAASITTLAPLLQMAARWHDLGKAHPAFQGAIKPDMRPDRVDVAKAPYDAWRRGRNIFRIEHMEADTQAETTDPPSSQDSRKTNGEKESPKVIIDDPRPSFRHELASVLGFFNVLTRWAPPEHPARLGHLASLIKEESTTPNNSQPHTKPTPVEAEVLALTAEEFNLVAYLICAHHGKLRARLHASPADQNVAVNKGTLPIRGIWEDDTLPQVKLPDKNGTLHPLPESQLSLEPATLGLSPVTGPSWTERVDNLREKYGPFWLAYLEALVRAADVRASKDKTLADPKFSTPPSTTPLNTTSEAMP